MESRKEQLLHLIVEQYIETGEPVGSKWLAEEDILEVSAATLRNEMRELEELGYLTHPHTSAGRTPTEHGYRYYVDHLMKPVVLSKKQKQDIHGVPEDGQPSAEKIKAIGRYVADAVGNAVIIAFGTDTVYYTGISNLFSQSEFRDYGLTVNVSSIFDHCEEYIPDVMDRVKDAPSVLIGKENPLGAFCSVVAVSLPQDILFSVLGPLRMQYALTTGFIQHIYSLYH